MYGYVFVATNTETGKKYVGVNRSVKFDEKFFGEDDALLMDIQKYGAHKFSSRMIMPCETEEALVACETAYIEAYKAMSDSDFYNCKKAEPVKKVEAPVKEEKVSVEENKSITEAAEELATTRKSRKKRGES